MAAAIQGHVTSDNTNNPTVWIERNDKSLKGLGLLEFGMGVKTLRFSQEREGYPRMLATTVKKKRHEMTRSHVHAYKSCAKVPFNFGYKQIH